MIHLRTFEGFFDRLFSSEEETAAIAPEEKKEVSYEEAAEGLLDSFDDIRAIDHYFGILKEMGREKEFLQSEKGRLFKELRAHMGR
jgi:hypothetical protein